jgi:hypothetical protein
VQEERPRAAHRPPEGGRALKRPALEALPHLERLEALRLKEVELLELALDELHAELARVDRRARHQRGHDPRHRADVVLVPVRDDERLDLVLPLREEGRVRQDLLHAVVLHTRRGGASAHGNGAACSRSIGCVLPEQVRRETYRGSSDVREAAERAGAATAWRITAE